ncbi:plectin isoform X2 [Anabrus simplex]|uniref:plectin isoform X2 n=1 Tax=Anabrus simplex TaxID=316456 RepID=UPI0035A36B8D
MASPSPKRSSSAERAANERLVCQLRNETASLREALEVEHKAVRELRRQRAAELRALREEEARRRSDSLTDLRNRLEHEHQEALQAQREALAKCVEAELTRAFNAKDAELRQVRAAAQRQQEMLQQQLRDALRLHAAPDHDCQKIAAEAARLRELNAQLEERIQALSREQTPQKSPRRTPKRTPSVDATGERMVTQLRAEVTALKEALEVERRAVKELRRQRTAELRAVREEEAKRRADSLNDLRTRLEHEHQEALQAQRDAMAKSVEAELMRALHAKDAEIRQVRATAQRQQEALQQQLRDALRRHSTPDHDCQKIAAEAARLREVNAELEERIRKLESAKGDSRSHPDMDKLRVQVEERDQEIANLRQAALEKDRKLEQMNTRCRYKEQIRQYCRFMDLEPVVELEEDSGGGEESTTSSGPSSLSPTPYSNELWAEDTVYACLLREHVELQRVHRSLEARLRRSEARARKLKELRRTWTDQLQQLQAETQELRELNELLEFRILELEEGHDQRRSIRSPVHDTRDVCTDTEAEDVSDSGVLSLPTSEEVGSDSDMGVHDLKIDVFKNLSEFATINSAFSKFPGRIVATVSPFSEMPHSSHESDKITKEDPEDSLSKQLKNAECLQESGIFEGDAVEWISRGTQTEGLSLNGELTAEIKKLTQFKERIEEERSGLLPANELAFCRERLQMLEEKVRVYESSGEQQAKLLAERLQRELVLAVQVKELSAKVARLQVDNSRLEEERCELEEAENDTRLRCQKLEAKLQELIDRKDEIQAKLEQERRANANLRKNLADGDKWRREARYLETVLSKYEQHNYELEEREMELRHRLELLQGCWPAVTLWNVWRILCSSCIKGPALPVEYKQSTSSNRSVPRRREYLKSSKQHSSHRRSQEEKPLLEKGKRPLNVSDTKSQGVQTEEGFTFIELQKSKEVEDKLFKTIDELQEELASLKERSKDWVTKTYSGHPAVPTKSRAAIVSVADSLRGTVELINADDMECMARLQQLAQAEIEMMNRIVELEQKETAYMETLQQADELWSELESGYQKQLQALRASEAELRARLEAAESRHRAARQSDETRVVELEQALVELQAALRKTEEDKAILATKVATLSEALAVAEEALERLQHEVDSVLKPRLCQERRLVADLQSELAHKSDAMEAMRESYESEIEKLKNQFAIAKRQCLSAHNECYQLKAEVQELKITIQDLRTCMEKQKNDDEKTLIHLTNLLAEKDRELEEVSMANRDAMARSAQEELEEALGVVGSSSHEVEAITSVQTPVNDNILTPEEEPASKRNAHI